MQDRGLAAYIAELLGTLLLVFFIGMVVTLYVATGTQATQFGSDFAVIGLVHALVLFALIQIFGGTSGGHFNPAITVAAAALRRIDPVDAVIYILAQLSGGVLGGLLVKGFLLDEGAAGHYGAATPSALIGGEAQTALIEGIGVFVLVLAVCAIALNPRARNEWAPLAIGMTLGAIVMIIGPLTGAAVNPARWFGPALIGEEFGGTWPYLVGPLVGALAAAAVARFVIFTSDSEVIGGPGTGEEEPPKRKSPVGAAASVETAAKGKTDAGKGDVA